MLQINNINNMTSYDVTDCVQKVDWNTVRNGKPGELSFSLLDTKNFTIELGNSVIFQKNGVNLFWGYIFKIKRSENDSIDITAYDQIRYLLNKDTLIKKNISADEILLHFAKNYKMKVGTIEKVPYKIPSISEDNQSILDIIYKALDYTVVNTKEMYVLYDDFGELCLKNIKNNVVDIVIGDKMFLTSYTYDENIDSDTYNYIKLAKSTSEGNHYSFEQDAENVLKWGVLQYYEKANDNMNEAQIKEKAKNLLKLKNRPEKKFSLECIGNVKVRGGCFIRILISKLNIDKLFLVENAKHSFSDNQHTMSLTLKVV